jgi:hypothetical protein
MPFTKTLQSVSNFCSTHADLLPMSGIGGFSNEPFLTIVNLALSDLITEENNWKINRAEMPFFVTCPQKQDQLFAGACAFSLGSTAQGWGVGLASNSAVTVTGGVVTVTFLENHRFAVNDVIYLNGLTMTTGVASYYNSVFTDTGKLSTWSQGYTITSVSSNSVTFAAGNGQNNGDAGGSPGIFDYFALSQGTVTQTVSQSSPQYGYGIDTYRELLKSPHVQNPQQFAVLFDYQNGILKIRAYPCPGSTTWSVYLVYQRQAPTKTSLADNWYPFPDNYSEVYIQSVIYRMYRWLNSPQQQVEYLKLQDAIKKAQGADDTEETSVSLQPEEPLMGLTGDNWFGW